MPFYDKNGTRILSPFEPKSDVILQDSSTDKLVSVQKSIQQNTEKVANEIAKQNRSGVRKFLLELFKAIIVGVVTLSIEHIFDIWAFLKPFFQSASPQQTLSVIAMVGLGLMIVRRMY